MDRGEIVERVMRLGAYRDHTFQELWTIAERQLAARPKDDDVVPIYKNLEDWFTGSTFHYAFTYISNKLTVIRIDDPSHAKLVSWRRGLTIWPVVELVRKQS